MSNNEIEETLKERGESYGSFLDNAEVSQGLKNVMENTHNWEDLPVDMKETLHMLVFKVSRIITGDCNYIDSWHDIIGYAKLIENRLIEEQEINIPSTKKSTLIKPRENFMGHKVYPLTDFNFSPNDAFTYIGNTKYVFLTRDNNTGYSLHRLEPNYVYSSCIWLSKDKQTVNINRFKDIDPLPLSLNAQDSIIVIQLY